MPRKKFTLAQDAAARQINCEHYDFRDGAPRCKALTHPWCLAPGESQMTCRFCMPPQSKESEGPSKRPKRGKAEAKEGADDGKE